MNKMTQLAEMDRDHGPVPDETLEWAARLVDGWQAARAAGEASDQSVAR